MDAAGDVVVAAAPAPGGGAEPGQPGPRAVAWATIIGATEAKLDAWAPQVENTVQGVNDRVQGVSDRVGGLHDRLETLLLTVTSLEKRTCEAVASGAKHIDSIIAGGRQALHELSNTQSKQLELVVQEATGVSTI